MPSIAYQDYIILEVDPIFDITDDAHLLGELSKILQRDDSSIFDVIIKDATSKLKVVSVMDEKTVQLVGFTQINVGVPYTSTQYEGLSAVQKSAYDITLESALPRFEDDSGCLKEAGSEYFITDLEGHFINVETEDIEELTYIKNVAVSDETDPDGIKVPFEEIQKLIGLPITVEQQG